MKSSPFLIIQTLLLLIIGVCLFYFQRRRRPSSQFKTRESDRIKAETLLFKKDDPLASAKNTSNPTLELPGIRLDVPPHELLGVRIDASERDIRTAYLEKIKRYHPDKVGPQGSREWKDAQTIAEHLNRAKDTLLKRKK